jgi:hypothetical protein
MVLFARLLSCVFLVASPLYDQSNATLQGRVFDASGAVLRGATVAVRSVARSFNQTAHTDDEGWYHVAAIPAGVYEVAASAPGFKSSVVEALTVEVGRTLAHDFRLEVGNTSDAVVVEAVRPLIDRTATVGHVVTEEIIQEVPLNGRDFADLGLLVPGSVAYPQTGFSAAPARGIGSLAFNTAGNREEAVAFVVNGVTTNNLTFGSLFFRPPIASVREFKVDNSAFNAEFGHVSGAVVNTVTRSGTDRFHGEAFEFLRDEVFDARNFFEFTSADPHPFERNQFGGSLGGPLIRGWGFFFVTYEGMRQRQGQDMNSLVLSDEQRAAATDSAARRLIELIPRSNFVDGDGTPRFIGVAEAAVDTDRWTVDFRQNIGERSRLHAFYGREADWAKDPSWNGNTIPGFGRVFTRNAGVATIDHTQLFGSRLLNEARFGRSTGDAIAWPGAELNPREFGISNGIVRPIGLPHIIVAGGLNFGGPPTYPTGRDDVSYVFTDTLSYMNGRHSVRLGGELRHFSNESFEEGIGAFTFPTVASFLAGTANAFSITLGERSTLIDQRALGLFVRDSIALRSNLTLEFGLRYEWHVTPTERDDKFVVFDPASASLRRVGVDIEDEIYAQNNRNFEPRLGLAWTPSDDGRTVIRGAYGLAVDEPSTTAVRNTTFNPPFATPVTAAGTIRLDGALATAQPVGLSPATIDPRFRNSSLHAWNVNAQRELATDLAALVGYFGSSGRNLRVSRNLNQPVSGVRPYPALSPSSPILPGTPLGNITQVESTGFSSYHALWLGATKRLSRGSQFDASYTWSKSLDTNSLNSSNFNVQDSYDIPNQYGLSDFDARHRFVLSGTYELPFTGHALTRGWHLAAIVQSQSGNPLNIVTSNSTLTGVPNTVRPDVVAPIYVIGSPDQWFDPAAFAAVNRFGNLGRNVVIGPSFHTTDLSVLKNMRPGRFRLQLRADVFNVFNHPNFGPPGNIVGSPTFGKITRTRFPTGEAGSSRQIQLAVKLAF